MRARLSLVVALLALAASARAADFFVFVDEDGTVHVTDEPRDPRFRPYEIGDFERWALAQSGAAHLGEGFERGAARQEAPSPFDDLIREVAARHGVDFALVKAVVAVESAFNPRAVSRAGAQGLMQLMPATGRELGLEDPFNAEANVDAGTRYLAGLLRAFRDERLALAAYNAGPSRVARAGKVPDIPETRAYVQKVQRLRQSYVRSR